MEGTPVRLTGQDSRRGTFVQRLAVLHARDNGQEWFPLTNIAEGQGRFWIYDSLLSEYAVMGFEYGYSVERPGALVLWEAQFGDFANGAQIVSPADQETMLRENAIGAGFRICRDRGPCPGGSSVRGVAGCSTTRPGPAPGGVGWCGGID